MTLDLLHAVAALASACSRRLSRAARKLREGGPALASRAPVLSRRVSSIPFFGGGQRKISGDDKEGGRSDGKLRIAEEEGREEKMAVEGEEGVWRRTILMGEKCQPVDFSGVIYYDGDGRRLSEIPTPRSPLRSPLPYFADPVRR